MLFYKIFSLTGKLIVILFYDYFQSDPVESLVAVVTTTNEDNTKEQLSHQEKNSPGLRRRNVYGMLFNVYYFTWTLNLHLFFTNSVTFLTNYYALYSSRSNAEDKIRENSEITSPDQAASIKLDASAQAHIEKHRCACLAS